MLTFVTCRILSSNIILPDPTVDPECVPPRLILDDSLSSANNRICDESMLSKGVSSNVVSLIHGMEYRLQKLES